MGRIHAGFLTRVAVAGAIASLALISRAEDAPGKADALPAQSSASTPPAPIAKKPMKMDEPMAGEMKKQGMMKGDMKKAAENKEREMKGEMEKEEKGMKK